MKKNLLLLGIILTGLVLSSAVAMTSSMDNGLEFNKFPTDYSVYIAHTGSSVYCNDVLENSELTVYITEDLDWTLGDSLSDYIQKTTVTTTNGKIQASMIWETPEAGSYDIIIDLNNDGTYSATAECADLIDGDANTGFEVVQAEASPEPAATSNDTEEAPVVEETAEPDVEEVTEPVDEETAVVTEDAASEQVAEPVSEQTEDTSAETFDYMPFVIIGIAVLIAAAMIVVTIIRMR